MNIPTYFSSNNVEKENISLMNRSTEYCYLLNVTSLLSKGTHLTRDTFKLIISSD